MNRVQSLTETYAETAINTTATWPKGTTPFAWRPGASPSRVGRQLVLKDNRKYGWYHQPPVMHYKELPEVTAWASPSGAGLDPRWRRFPAQRERDVMPLVHVFDRNGSYLSSASSAALPCGTPQWVEGAEYVKIPGKSAQAGLWHVNVAYNGSPFDGYVLPAVCAEGETWLWSETVRCAQECGYTVTPERGAILWPEQHKALGVWATHLWAARRALETNETDQFGDFTARREALALVKHVYTDTIGMFGMTPRENDAPTQEEIEAGLSDDAQSLPRWRRPEWQRTIKAAAAAWMFYYVRKSVANDYAPLWMQADSLAFPGIGAAQETADAAGLNTTPNQCGAMHHDCAVPMPEAALYEARGRTIAVPGRSHELKLPGVRVRQ